MIFLILQSVFAPTINHLPRAHQFGADPSLGRLIAAWGHQSFQNANREYSSTLSQSCIQGDLDAINFYFQSPQITEEMKHECMSTAASRGHLHVLRAFYDEFDSYQNRNLLFQGYPGVIPFLQEKGFDLNTPSAHGHHAIQYHALTGNLGAVRDLINCGIDVNFRGGIDVNFRDLNGEPALCKAVMRGHMDVVQYLVEEANANILLGDLINHDWTPLFWATERKFPEIANYLRDRM